MRVLLQVSAHEQVVLIANRVIELENAGVQRTGIRRSKGIGQQVVAVSLGGSVGQRKLLEKRQGGGVRSGGGANAVCQATGIKGGNLRRGKGVG